MEESENLNLEKNDTHQLHNFINPYDREGGYILFSGGYSKEEKIDRKSYSPIRYLMMKDWHELKSILPYFTPYADTYLLPSCPLSESKFRSNVISKDLVEYKNIYNFFEQRDDIGQQRKSTLISLCFLLAENYVFEFGGIPRGIKWLAARLGTNSRKITDCIKSLVKMELIIFHKKRADIDSVTLPCFIEPTRTFLFTFTSLFVEDKTKEESGEKATHREKNYQKRMSIIAKKESIYTSKDESSNTSSIDYYLYGKEGFFWYQNQLYTLKVNLLKLVRDPQVDDAVKVHAYRILL
ncbi:hypothetical protein KW497_19335 [Vibrio fluvialis]|uniref:hypothetical protein n=1 Tax=Vibrio TaxID=662 RepID=UPI000893D8DB|nr:MULTISPECIES: hypothetical protein [Vibrio]EGQ9392148.1 hypothetical protein [Vibrio cholerae]EGR0142660.1 hypothetical protein [Vibrio cholerae]EGR0539543.1 hypothetical protein [Vibrio cholerae]EGR2311188.1 hypothetical protein [Vibrio cholerae]EHD2266764.1 hypothetical protein [Vibrio cholerae]